MARATVRRIVGATDRGRYRGELHGADRHAHAALCGTRAGPVGPVVVGARCRAQGVSAGELGSRAIYVGVEQSRRPPCRHHRRQPPRQPVARATARAPGRRSRHPALPAEDSASAGPAVPRGVHVLFVVQRERGWAVAARGRTGVRSRERRRRGIIRAARCVAGRKPRGHHRPAREETATRHRVGRRQKLANVGPVARHSRRCRAGDRGLVAGRHVDRDGRQRRQRFWVVQDPRG